MQNKKYDLEDRTLKFSKDCIDLCKLLKLARIFASIGKDNS
jgi:hypothetical protein